MTDGIKVEEIFPADFMVIIQEQYPHVGALLESTWGTKWFDHYVKDIQFSDRPNRQGFPMETVLLLQLLEDLHKQLEKGNCTYFEKLLS